MGMGVEVEWGLGCCGLSRHKHALYRVKMSLLRGWKPHKVGDCEWTRWHRVISHVTPGTAQSSFSGVVWCSVVQISVVWCGVVWRVMVWVRCGAVWCAHWGGTGTGTFTPTPPPHRSWNLAGKCWTIDAKGAIRKICLL